VIDILRALRCADALRQRGTVLETSGQYQLFVDGATGGAVCAIHARGRSLLVSIPLPMTGGEANLAGGELDRDGNLRVSFHRGAFADEEAVRRAVDCAALVVDDMQADIRESFCWAGDGAARRSGRDMLILLEGVDDNPEFACRVRARLLSLNPGLEGYVAVAPSLRRAPERERTRYLEGETLQADAETRRG
jgi:hypothetical protein